jgi:exopolysaccharide production protein ExoZ
LDYAIVSVDLFFVISGFVIATVTRGQFQSLRAAGHFLFQRATRIYPTYWFYSTLVLIIWICKPEVVNSAQDNQVNILASFLIIPQDLLPLVMVGWTLVHEMYFYIIVTILMPIVPERAFPNFLALWALIVIIGSSHFMANLVGNYNPAIQIALHPLTLDFIGGVAIALFLNGNNRKNERLIIGIGISAFLFSVIWLGVHDLTLKTQGWRRVLLFGIPSLLVVYGAVRAGKYAFQK